MTSREARTALVAALSLGGLPGFGRSGRPSTATTPTSHTLRRQERAAAKRLRKREKRLTDVIARQEGRVRCREQAATHEYVRRGGYTVADITLDWRVVPRERNG